jgi:hypothetical protein
VWHECLHLNSDCDSIAPSITYLINLSILEGVFPSNLKIAKISPLFKSGDKSLPGNYRPIVSQKFSFEQSALAELLPIFEKKLYQFIDYIFKITTSFVFKFHRCHFHKSGDWVNFRYWRNKCKTLIEKSKLEYFQKIVEENKEPKEIWKLLIFILSVKDPCH